MWPFKKSVAAPVMPTFTHVCSVEETLSIAAAKDNIDLAENLWSSTADNQAISTYLSTCYRLRTKTFGGPNERRARYWQLVFEAVKPSCPPEFPNGEPIKVSVDLAGYRARLTVTLLHAKDTL